MINTNHLYVPFKPHKRTIWRTALLDSIPNAKFPSDSLKTKSFRNGLHLRALLFCCQWNMLPSSAYGFKRLQMYVGSIAVTIGQQGAVISSRSFYPCVRSS